MEALDLREATGSVMVLRSSNRDKRSIMVSAWAADEARAAAFKVVVKRGLYEDAIVVPVGGLRA